MGNFWLAEKLLASHEGLSCIDLVSSEHISCNVLNKERNWMRQERKVKRLVEEQNLYIFVSELRLPADQNIRYLCIRVRGYQDGRILG